MSVKLRCLKCNAPIRVAEEFAGKLVRCPKCRSVITAAVESDERPDDLRASEHSKALAAAEKADSFKKSVSVPADSQRTPAGNADEKVGERTPNRALKSSNALWIILGATAAAACGLVVLAAIVFSRFGPVWRNGSSAAQTAPSAVAATPGESPSQSESASTESALTPQDFDESAAKDSDHQMVERDVNAVSK